MGMSLEEVAALAAQLSPKDNLALAARLSDEARYGESGERTAESTDSEWQWLFSLAGTTDGPTDW